MATKKKPDPTPRGARGEGRPALPPEERRVHVTSQLRWTASELAALKAYGLSLAPGLAEGPPVTEIIRTAALKEVARHEARSRKGARR